MLKRVNIIQNNCYVGYVNSHGGKNKEIVINAVKSLFAEDSENLFLLNYNEDNFVGTILNVDKTDIYYKILSDNLESIVLNKNSVNWEDYLTHNKLNLTQEDEIDPYDMAF